MKRQKQSNTAAIRNLLLTFTMHSIQQRKLKLLMPVLQINQSYPQIATANLGG